MVARVDTVLKEELGIKAGLADDNVYILDPCCGTGAFLVEVLKRINQTLAEQGEESLRGLILKKAAKKRVFGFEILTAPFVVAHLQLGVLLQNLGASLDGAQERVGVYLTNALTGWEPPDDEAKQKFRQLILNYPELEEEREAADDVKRGKPILVVLGNPPYNAYAGVSPTEEKGLVEVYKQGLIKDWGIKKFNLDDLYIRFFRIAEQCIAHQEPRRGVVCYISNQSWVSDPSFVVLRQKLLKSFDKFWIENMHGNRKISEYAPDGKTSETIFAIQGFSSGIQQGVAISLWVKTAGESSEKIVKFRNNIHDAKANERRLHLLQTLQEKDFDRHYQIVLPRDVNRFSFRPSQIEANYLEWVKVTELCAVAPNNGLMEKRGGALVDIDREILEQRMQAYFNPDLDWEAYKMLGYGLVRPQASFDPKTVRQKAILREKFDPHQVIRYGLRPFDTRWCYYTSFSGIWNRSRPSLWKQCWPGNKFLLTRFRAAKEPEGTPFYFTPYLSDDHLLTPDAVAISLKLMNGARLKAQERLVLMEMLGQKPEVDVPIANLSPGARRYLADLGLPNPDEDDQTAVLIWMHVLAIGYSPRYLQENSDGIRQDFPRIPLPNDRNLLVASAQLGQQLANYLDTETPVEGVTTGTIHPNLRSIAVMAKAGGGQFNTEADLALTAGWGRLGKGDITMPGKGKLEKRGYNPQELANLSAADQVALGTVTHDIYLNESAYWQNIPEAVWNYTIGGYPVIKKWLSYREEPLLGRPLKLEEAQEVSHMARRIAAILLLEPELDAHYESVKQATYYWPNALE